MSRRQKRHRFVQWLRNCLGWESSVEAGRCVSASLNRSVKLESLENRALMAGDTLSPLLGSAYVSQPQAGMSTEGLRGEGEAANDLVAFAKAIRDSGAIMYGAYWCPVCQAQKELFQDGARFLPYVEVTDSQRRPTSVATTNGIERYPTWVFLDGTRIDRQATLAELATKIGVAIPQSSTPSVATIPNTNVEVGSPMHMPVDAYDPNGNPLTITVTSSNPSVISAEMMPQGDKSLRIRVKDFGEMTFKLFQTEAGIPVQKIIDLVNSGFYTNSPFHRVINNFMIQTGTSATNATTPNIDDQFDLDLQHNRSGVLAYAKTEADDSGNSQFYITEKDTRHLDFNHPIFGQLIEGDAVREAISNVATSANAPTVPIVIESATIFDDRENGLIRLKALANTGTSTITVTITDTEGNSTSTSFVATAVPDASNGAPFLNAVSPVSTPQNTPVTINLTSQDAENNPVTYTVAKDTVGDYTVQVNATTGVVTFTPGATFTGAAQFRATVQQTAPTDTQAPTDSQLITVNVVGATAPTAVDLDTASDLGASNSDNLTSASSPTFTVSGTTSGAVVRLKVGNTVIGQATATGTTTVVTANNISSLGQGAVLVTATQTVNNAESTASPSLSVTFDTVAPADVVSSLFPASAIVSQALNINLTHAEEGTGGLVYALENAPTGMTIDAATGVIAWTPTQSQLGARAFSLKLTDRAGNTKTQAISINVIEQPLAKVTLEVVDMQGNPITQIATGQQFRVRFLTQDVRGALATGVFGSYIDLLFDPAVVEPIATNPITYADPFVNGKSPKVDTPAVAGQINELGAFGGSTPTDGDPKLIATVTFVAKAAGNANIRSDQADLNGSDILFFNRNQAIPKSQVDYGAANLVVGANFVATNDTFNFNEDSGVQSLNVLANDTITGTGTLTIVSATKPSGFGTVTVAADGKSINYTPGQNFNGSETFTYTVRNQDNVSLTATVTVQVADVNDPPVATNDTFDVNIGTTPNTLNVLQNDATGVDTPASETLRVSAVGTTSQGGTVTIGASGLNVIYTPKSGFTGTDIFTYTLSDGRGGTATGTVSVNVKVANPPPVAIADSFPVNEDADEASFNVLANDTTDAGETLTVDSVGTSSRGSTFKVSTDKKTVLYKPGLNVTGPEVLTYVVKDSGGATATGTVTFNIAGVNDAPDAVNDTTSVLSSAGNSTLTVLANDTDPDTGTSLTITAVTQPASGQGTVAISSDKKSLIYTPPSNTFAGSVSFTYTISDGTLTDTATVALTVNNFVPRTIGGNLAANTGSTATIGGVDLQLTGTDITGAAKSLTVSTNHMGSFVSDNLAPGTYTITRPALPFLEDRGDSMTITSTATDTSTTALKSLVGSLKSQFISIRDFLGSAAAHSITLAVAPGSGESWYAIRNGMTGFSNIQARLDAAATNLTVTATNPSNQNVTATLPLTGTNSKVSVLASDNNTRLLRITGTDTISFSTVSTSSTGSGEGEGGSAARTQSAPSTRSTSGLVAEGEAAPPVEAVNRMLTPSQALRQALGSNVGSNGFNSTRITATNQLPPGAVDSALSEIDTLSLMGSQVEELTQTPNSLEDLDSALASL